MDPTLPSWRAALKKHNIKQKSHHFSNLPGGILVMVPTLSSQKKALKDRNDQEKSQNDERLSVLRDCFRLEDSLRPPLPRPSAHHCEPQDQGSFFNGCFATSLGVLAPLGSDSPDRLVACMACLGALEGTLETMQQKQEDAAKWCTQSVYTVRVCVGCRRKPVGDGAIGRRSPHARGSLRSRQQEPRQPTPVQTYVCRPFI